MGVVSEGSGAAEPAENAKADLSLEPAKHAKVDLYPSTMIRVEQFFSADKTWFLAL